MRVVWTHAALDELNRIHDYLAEHSPQAAIRVTRQLRRAGDGLEHFPRRGARFQEPICGNWRPPAATSSDTRSLTTWLSFCASATPPAVRRTHNASRERPPDPSPVLDRVLLPRQDGEHDLVEPGGLDGGDA